MEITFDPAKNERNIKERGLSFERASEFGWGEAIFDEDTRKVYPERRFLATGYLDKRLHILCFTETERGIRVISFRKANQREARNHDKALTID